MSEKTPLQCMDYAMEKMYTLVRNLEIENESLRCCGNCMSYLVDGVSGAYILMCNRDGLFHVPHDLCKKWVLK